MYSLMMLEGIVLLYCHVVLWQALQAGQKPPRAVWPGLFAVTMAGGADAVFLFLVFCFSSAGCSASAAGYAAVQDGGRLCDRRVCRAGCGVCGLPHDEGPYLLRLPRKEAFASVFDLSALAEWGQEHRHGGAAAGGPVRRALAVGRGVAAAAVVLWRRDCRLRGKGLFAAGLLLASAGYVALIDKAAPFEADRYYVVIYAAVVLAVAVVLARLAPKHETPAAAGTGADPLRRTGPTPTPTWEDAAPRKAALADTERLPAVVLNKAGYEVAPDLFLEEFAKREAADQASGEDDAASLRAAVESRDLHGGFLLYGYIYDADELRALAEDTLDVEKIELVTDGERCPVYYIELK